MLPESELWSISSFFFSEKKKQQQQKTEKPLPMAYSCYTTFNSLQNISLNRPDREELITEHVLSWNKRKIFDLVPSIVKRYTRVGI